MLLGDGVERGKLADAGIGEENVDAPEFRFHLGVERVEIGELRHVALHADRAMADRGDGRVELGLAAAGHDHLRALGGEELRRRQSDSAIAARDDGDFSRKACPYRSPW